MHENWRTWDKLKDCLGLTKVQMDGCEKDSTKTCRGRRHQHEARFWPGKSREKLEMDPSSLSSLARPRDETVLSRSVEKTHAQDEQPVRKMSKKPTKLKRQDSRAVFLSMDVTSSASQQKRFVNRPGQFVASQLKKRKVEVSVKNLSQDELKQLH